MQINCRYSQRQYWDQRFKNQQEYDWLGSFSSYSQYLLSSPNFQNHDSAVLVLGCGNSSLSRDLADKGFRNVLSTDYSPVVIQNMQKKQPQLQWAVLDMNDLSHLHPKKFDIVLDKGALDAVMSKQKDVWQPQAQLKEQVRNIMEQVKGVMSESSEYIQISFQQPHFRRKYLQGLGLKVQVQQVDVGLGYFIYRMTI